MKTAQSSSRHVFFFAGIVFVFILAACVGQPAGQSTGSASPAASPSASPAGSVTGSPVAAAQTGTALASPVGTGTAAAGGTPTTVTPTAAASGTPSPGLSVAAQVTPSDLNVGNVTLSLVLLPARHMFDQASMATPDPAQPTPDNSKNQNVGSVVFAGGMVDVTNNIDPSQPAPADSAQSIIRHVVVEVKSKDHSQVIPYLGVSMDVLLDGHPVLYDQAMEPMIDLNANPPQLYYGNNVKFPQKGTYQVFVRLQSNPLLGKDQPTAAQFNLVLR